MLKPVPKQIQQWFFYAYYDGMLQKITIEATGRDTDSEGLQVEMRIQDKDERFVEKYQVDHPKKDDGVIWTEQSLQADILAMIKGMQVNPKISLASNVAHKKQDSIVSPLDMSDYRAQQARELSALLDKYEPFQIIKLINNMTRAGLEKKYGRKNLVPFFASLGIKYE